MCDIDDKQAVERLYQIKGLSPKKQLSILCRHFQDISTYTLGFPASNQPGQQDTFRLARQVLPGPVSVHIQDAAHEPFHIGLSLYASLQYTFILTASKQLPKQCTDYQSGKTKQRKSVGVRMPDDITLQVTNLAAAHCGAKPSHRRY